MGFFSRRKPDVRFNLLVILMLVQAGWSRTDYRMHRKGLEGLTKLLVVKSNDSERANHVCGQYGYSFIRRVFDDENYYLFQRDDAGRRPTLERLGRHPEIEWVSGQSVKRRVRRFSLRKKSSIQRGLLLSELLKSESPSNATPTFNDPLFTQQWYLHNSGQTGSPPRNDINVLPVWQLGITGRGVAIEVLDDGVHAQSEEVAANYESTLSEEYLFRKRSLQPIPENSHGTRCAAVAAGVANNGVCGVGVAYEAKVGGVRLLDGDLTDVQEALALVHALDRVDIYTASWGPMDKGRAVDGPQTLARLAFQKGVTMGRHGKGSIYVWAAGNGGGYHDNCSVDGYASNPYTLTIGALTEDGRSAFYSEPCPAVIAATYVGGREHRPPTHREWEVDRERVKVVVPAGRGKCQSTFQGTSAAAPMAAGIVALALQANPDLTWRDVRHLIIRTSRVPTPPERGWTRNAAGFHFHPQMGSGALDAHALVRMAREWTPVGELKVWTTRPRITTRLLPPRRRIRIRIPIRTSSSPDLGGRHVDRLETVISTLSMRHARGRGHLEVDLRSPGGTTSQLLARRPLDNSTTGFDRWDFVSLHFWGEDPDGEWTLGISNHHRTIEGFLDYFAIALHGTSDSVNR